MKNIIKYLLVFSLFTSLASCVKDRGNYHYSDIPEISLENFALELNGAAVTLNSENTLVVEHGDLLKISNKEEDKFDAAYSWKIFEKSPNPDADGNYEPAVEISTQRDYNANFTYPPGKYVLAYEVVNKANNSKFAVGFNIEVESVSGIFVLHAINGVGDYSAIRTAEVFPNLPATKLGVNYSLFSASNNGDKLNNPKKIFMRPTVHIYAVRSIFVAEEGNLTTVDYNSLKTISRNYESQFVFKPDGYFDAQAHLVGVNNKELLIAGGKIHAIDYSSGGGPFGPNIGTYSKNYAPFLVALSTIRIHVVFNETDKKFQIVNQFASLGEFSTSSGEVNGLDTKMDLLFLDKGNGDVIDAVMEDIGGGIFYVKFNLTSSTISCTKKIALNNLPGISVDTKWAVGSRGDATMYASGNELYVLNNSNGQSTAVNLGLPASANISTIKILKDVANTTYDNALLLIGVNEGNVGKVYQYAFNPLSGVVDLASKKEFVGFEPIVDIIVKK